MKKKQWIGITVDADLAREADAFAHRRELSRSAVFNRAAAFFLARMNPNVGEKAIAESRRSNGFDLELSRRLDCVLFLEEHENDPKWQKFLNDYRTDLERGIHAD